jgi:hypothetical protein
VVDLRADHHTFEYAALDLYLCARWLYRCVPLRRLGHGLTIC